MKLALYDIGNLQCLGSTEVTPDEIRRSVPWKLRFQTRPVGCDAPQDIALEAVAVWIPDEKQNRIRPSRTFVAVAADIESAQWLRFARFPDTIEPPVEVMPQHRPWVAKQIRAALGMEAT